MSWILHQLLGLIRGENMKQISLFTLFVILCAWLSAQEAYLFSQSTETYMEISEGISLGNESTANQVFVNPSFPLGGSVQTGPGFPIGFDFTFNETVFDRIAINANGWISFGQSALSPSVNISTSTSYSPLSSSVVITPAILGNRASVFACDLQAQPGATLLMQTIGIVPNRKCIIQWKDYRRYHFTGDNLNFQIVLTETANSIQFRYSDHPVSSTETSYIQVGLRGPESSNFFNRSSTTDWAETTAGTTNAAYITFSNTIKPASGLVFTYNTLNSNFFAGGTGTLQDPYQVATAEHLNNVRYRLQGHFIQTADISLGLAPWNQEEGWIPISDFSGTYNGDGKTITGLYINRPSSSYQGLFGQISSTTISNLNIVSGTVTGSEYTGGLVGSASGTIENCSSSATIIGTGENTGGLIGDFSTGTITLCSATGHVTGLSYVGGLAGTASGTIENCNSSATVIGSGENTGGLIGDFSDGTIEDCSATGAVTGLSKVGGLAGAANGTIENCYSSATVSGSGDYTGGLIGSASGTIENCYSSATVSGSGENTGGLIGDFSDGTIEDCFATGDVTGSSKVGGLAGTANGTIKNCYSSATVSGSGENTGGLIGDFSDGTIKYCFTTGDVTGSAKVGGLVGHNNESASIIQSYTTSDVAGSSKVGGLAGHNNSASTIQNCFAEGDVIRISGNNTEFGGFCGCNDDSQINKSYSLGKVLQSPEGPVWEDRGFLGAIPTGSSDQMTGNFFCTETSGASSSFGSTVGKDIAHMQYVPTFTDAAWDFQNVWAAFSGYPIYPRLRVTDLFYANTRSGYAPLTVTFHDISGVANASSWDWNFGDGSSSTEQNPSHQYATTGAYTVSLSVSNGVATAARAVPNYVNIVEHASAFHLMAPSSFTEDMDVYPRFEWGADDTRDLTPFHYELILSTNPLFTPATTVVYSTTNTYLYPPQDLKVGTDYFWKVKACFEDNAEMTADMGGQGYWTLTTVAQTPLTFPKIYGLIPDNRTLIKENSPYWFDIAPKTGKHHKLTFEAGVTLKFNSGIGLTLGGEFLCEGTAVDPVTFEGYSNATLWSGIIINNENPDSVVNGSLIVSNNQFNHTVIKNVFGTALSIPNAETGGLSFTNCRFSQNSGLNIISINSALPVYIGNNVFSQNICDNLIELQNPSGSCTVTENEISNNEGFSLIKCSVGTLNINNNTISLNRLYGKAAIWAAGGTVNIEKNTLTYNEADIMADNNMATVVYIEPGSTCSITKNLITNNTGPYAIWGAAQEIKDNNIFGNVNADYYPMNIRHTNLSNRAYINNFWGSRSDLGNINPTLYHNNWDPALGVITYQPIRTGPSHLTPGQLSIVNDVMVTTTEEDITPNTSGLIPERYVFICLNGVDGNAFSQDITEVNVSNITKGLSLQPLVWETGDNTGIFRTKIFISETEHNSQLGILQVSSGDNIRFQSIVDPTKVYYLPVLAPSGLPDAFFFVQDESLTIDFTNYVEDEDINELTLSYSGATNVIVSITGLSVTFTATPNWQGTENLTFTVSSGRFSTNYQVEVNVTPPLLDSPIISSIVKTLAGIEIKWLPVSRAASYRVYRSFEPYGEYTDFLGSTDETVFVDTEFGNHPRAFYRIVGIDQEYERK